MKNLDFVKKMNHTVQGNASTLNNEETKPALEEARIQKLVDHLPLIIILFIIAIIGVIGNILTIIFYGFKTKKSSTTVLITYLAIFDLIMCFLIFTTITDLFVNITFTNSILCKIMYFCDHWIAVTSVYVLCIISVDRYRRMCKPLARQFSTRFALGATITVCFISMAWSTHDFVTISPVTINISTSNEKIPVVTGYYCTNTDEPNLKTVVTVFHILDAVSIFLVLVVFIYTYGNIWYTLRKHNRNTSHIRTMKKDISSDHLNLKHLQTVGSKNQSTDSLNNATSQSEALSTDDVNETGENKSTAQETSSVNFSLGSDTDTMRQDKPAFSVTNISRLSGVKENTETKANKRKISRLFNSERSVTVMMFAVTIGFAICFTPYFIVNIGIRVMSETTEDELNTGIEFALRSPFWNSVINPIIFCVFNSKYRLYVKDIFTKCRINRKAMNYSDG